MRTKSWPSLSNPINGGKKLTEEGGRRGRGGVFINPKKKKIVGC